MDDLRLGVVDQVVSCTNCELHTQCRSPVPLQGGRANIAVIGEAPGEQEDRVGVPFVGPAGKHLKAMLSSVGITEDVAALNTVSCFPHGTPEPSHVAACDGNKWSQIAVVDARYHLLLGRVALKAMRPDLELGHARGRPFLVRNRVCFATYHPAAALRNGRFDTWMRQDLKLFSAMVTLDDWEAIIPDSCAGCAAPATWYEDTGLGWCPIHMPKEITAAYHARMQQLKDELAEARRGASR
jgi:uracil-DNA glycosylase family 4